jgi:tetratricopeptide (TPR) repeat protein
VVYESLSAGTRGMLHERLAAYLEALAGADLEPYLETLAYHYDRSALQDKQRRFHLLAAQAALRRYANDSALAHFSRVLELTPDDAPEARFEVLLARERVCHLAADRQRQKEDIDALLGLLERCGDPARKIAVMEEQIFYQVHTGQYDQVDQTARRVVEFADQHQIALDLTLYREWGVALSFMGNSQQGRQIIEAGLQRAERAGNLLDKAKLLNALAVILLFQGEYLQIPDILSLSLSIFRDIGDRREEVNASIAMLYAAVFSGNMLDMEQFGYQALYLVDVIGDRYLEAWVLLNFGTVLGHLGSFSEALSMLEQARALSRAHDDINCEGAAWSSLGMIYNALGKHEHAQRYYEKSIDIAARLQNPFHLSERLAMLGWTRHLLEDDHGAAAHYQQSLAISVPAHFRHEQAIALTFQAHTLAALLELDQAEELYHKVLELRQTLQQSHLINEPRAGLAAVALARHRQTGHAHQLRAALGYVEAALPHIETWNLAGTHDPLEICRVCHRVLLAAGDERAPAVLGIAHAELQRRAASIDDEATRARYLARPAHAQIIEAHSGAA